MSSTRQIFWNAALDRGAQGGGAPSLLAGATSRDWGRVGLGAAWSYGFEMLPRGLPCTAQQG